MDIKNLEKIESQTFRKLISLVSILINHQLKGVSDDQ